MKIGRIATVLWFALLVSQVIYVVIGDMAFGATVPDEPLDPAMSMMLSVMAMCSIFAGVCVHAFGVRRGLSAGKFDLSTERGQRSVFVLLIISWALCESAAIYGFVLRALGAPGELHLQFAVAAGLAHLTVGPWIPALHRKS